MQPRQIYNEEVRDLLGEDTKARLDLKEHPDKGVFVQGLVEEVCARAFPFFFLQLHHFLLSGGLGC